MIKDTVPATMESKEINSGLLMRLFTLFLYNISRIPCVRRLRKHPERILLVSSKLCIKATAFTTLTEANAMEFVANNTSIPVPKVYCSFKHKGRVYILMERIRGRDLSQDWTQRSEASKTRILAQLKTLITELRRIPPPDGVSVANVDGGPVFDQRLPDKSFWGPFATIQEFHRELRRGLELHDDEEAFPGLRELIEFYNGLWEDPVFTHGDLSSLNIMADGDTVTGIVDWESAGWMPPYWEYTSAVLWRILTELQLYDSFIITIVHHSKPSWHKCLSAKQIIQGHFASVKTVVEQLEHRAGSTRLSAQCTT